MSVKALLQEFIDSPDIEVSMTEKQVNILSAAIEIFSEKGFAATSTSEIAKKAGVAEGTIFRHYKTKKDLLFAIPVCLSNLSISKVFIQDMTKIIENPTMQFEDFLRAIIQNRSHFAASNMVILKVMIQEVAFHSEIRPMIIQLISGPIQEKLINAIDRFKERGEIIDLPSGTVVKLIISSVLGYMFMRYIVQLDLEWNHEKDTDDLVNYIMNGICTKK